jgi:hypothetical protein
VIVIVDMRGTKETVPHAMMYRDVSKHKEAESWKKNSRLKKKGNHQSTEHSPFISIACKEHSFGDFMSQKKGRTPRCCDVWTTTRPALHCFCVE